MKPQLPQLRHDQHFAIRVIEETILHGSVRGVEMNADAGLQGRVAIAAHGDDPSRKSLALAGMGSGAQRIWLGFGVASLKGPLRRVPVSIYETVDVERRGGCDRSRTSALRRARAVKALPVTAPHTGRKDSFAGNFVRGATRPLALRWRIRCRSRTDIEDPKKYISLVTLSHPKSEPPLAYTPAKEMENPKCEDDSKLDLVAAMAALRCCRLARPKRKLLYDRLGGKKAITAVVDDFVGRVAADTRINMYFAAAAADPQRMASFKMKLVDQICQASGGPCKYMGKDMKTAHMGMGITGPQFDALVEDLVGALDKFKVGEKEKDDLLGALGPMKPEIVEK